MQHLQDVEERRGHYPALQRGVVYLDGPGGSQVPRPVIDAMSEALESSMSNVGWGFPGSERSERTVRSARTAVADLLGAEADGVAFGASMTALTYRISATLGSTWQPGDEIVVTELDHDANVRPWVHAAEQSGATVRWARVDPETCELPVGEVERLLSDRTRLVAVTGASNAVGIRPDVPSIARLAHDAGALVYVDAVHTVPHGPVSLESTGADFVVCSAYKFFGPHLGCLAAAPELLASLHPPKLAPATDRVPERFELGTLPFEQLAGVTAAVDFLASLTPGEPGESRRTRLVRAMTAIDAYCAELFDRLITGLQAIAGVTVFGRSDSRAPTLCFTVAGKATRDVALELAAKGFNVSSGNFYAYELLRRLDLYDRGGVVRVGLLHYNTETEVDALLAAVAETART